MIDPGLQTTKKFPMTNKDLRRLYSFYNTKWFDGKLPEITVHFGDIEKGCLGDTEFIGNDPVIITIARNIKTWNRLVRSVLIHEMCHVSLPVRIVHGPRFEARMRELAARGAFTGLW